MGEKKKGVEQFINGEVKARDHGHKTQHHGIHGSVGGVIITGKISRVFGGRFNVHGIVITLAYFYVEGK